MIIPKIPLDIAVDKFIDYATTNFAFITKAISKYMKTGIDSVNDFLMFIPPLILIIIFVILVWYFSTRSIAIFTALGLFFIWNLGLWSASIITLTLVLIATFISVLIGIPFGILAALKPGVKKVTMPVLDFMQTMPAFVYLIPAIPFFGLGVVSAVFTTVIFSMPPAIRFTCLGIQQIPAEYIEAADSFGATKKQKLLQIQLPLAMPTIMAGINQTIMLALSMVVIASMIGAGGLGGEVWRAIQRLQPGMGFEAGIAVVIMAIVLDRITQNIKKKNE
ncbi:MAG: proline/glycine betaine ABC transporter permease [Spirochaetota bacterium]